ncbi:glycoside hydrolase [Paenibacillus sp. SYP-B3998]|uniref:Glycoside hydrolase n=1 Tax=Paenibacillus sp. SYP-B3998 TaxID=2678564 RepID=A0A6G3ZWE7_9BACL|nr:glycoside hydrolase [Paenibacillus sp. SYP-B3998]NEW06533.1 glycoside hydrolase [Paenibacillus sp. SYP-B3998]
MRTWLRLIWCLLCLILILGGCESSNPEIRPDAASDEGQTHPAASSANFAFDVDPETFEITIEKEGHREIASDPLPKRKVIDLQKEKDRFSWTYPDDQMKVNIQRVTDHLQVSLTSTGAETFTWPKVSGTSYMLPLGEGKRIPSNDPDWISFLKDESMSFSEAFSMRFFALNKNNYAVLYIVENSFRNTVNFDTNPHISFALSHDFSTVDPDKTYSFRIYVTDNNPVSIASLYKRFIQEKGEFRTLAEKAAKNQNIEKLYGAPHIYVWNQSFLSNKDIQWSQLKAKLDKPFMDWVVSLLLKVDEDGQEKAKSFKEIRKQDYVDDYQKKTIISGLNRVLREKDFYNRGIFTELDEVSRKYVDRGLEHINEVELYDLNKRVLKSKLGAAAAPVEAWGSKDSTELLGKLQDAGIKHAWLGLPNWTAAYKKPDFVKQANESGYLIAAYDSYHSIHQEENPDWNTAIFKDKSLYEKATMSKKNGEKRTGFLGKGRILNPMLSLPSVKERMNTILSTGIPFNSWFIDVDAAGEFHDDYAPDHTMTEKQDMEAKLARMTFIRDEKKLVIGSESGNDYASSTIAYAHGIETPVIKWGDPDMRTNKNSPYYVGGYWTPLGDVPERYGKQVPVKDEYLKVYIDPVYSLPLYKLVYNNSVITTHHWEWGSLKIKDQIGTRMLKELLYNVPPLYQLDDATWEKNKQWIVPYLAVWSPMHEKAIKQEMTAYTSLSADNLVQSTSYGADLTIVVNFSTNDFTASNHDIIPKRTAVIYDGKEKRTFTAPAI